MLSGFLFDGDIESILFLMWVLYSSTIRIFGQSVHTPAYAVHSLDIIAQRLALETLAINTCGTEHQADEECYAAAAAAEAEATAPTILSTTAQPQMKYCGRTIGETAATCGMYIAYTVMFDNKLDAVQHVGQQINDYYWNAIQRILQWLWSYKHFRDFYSHVYGYILNTIEDVYEMYQHYVPKQ